MEIFLRGTNKQAINGKPAGDFIKKLMSDITNQAINPLNALLGPKFTQLGITHTQREISKNIKILKQWALCFIRKRIKEINAQLQEKKNSKNPEDII